LYIDYEKKYVILSVVAVSGGKIVEGEVTK
jgi:hypothetical protein